MTTDAKMNADGSVTLNIDDAALENFAGELIQDSMAVEAMVAENQDWIQGSFEKLATTDTSGVMQAWMAFGEKFGPKLDAMKGSLEKVAESVAMENGPAI